MELATVDKLLTTTRTVRRRLDLTRPVPRAVIEECLDIAIQAPTGGSSMELFSSTLRPLPQTPLSVIAAT